MQRPFEAHNHDGLASKIRQAEPPFPLTNPPVSNACLITARGLLSKDSTQRVGTAGFDTFTNSPFFRPINFVALEKKELEPVFRPSSEKTNFDATYDLEELLLEEAPLEARARRQKPREQLKVDATREEIRADELHRMIEKLFEPFDYTLAQYDKSRMSDTADSPLISQTGTITSGADWSGKPHLSNQEASATTPKSGYSETIGTGGPMDPLHIQSKGFQNTYAESLKGSPPLPTIDLHANHPPRSVPGDYFSESLPPPPQPESRPQSRPHSSRSTSKNRKGLLSRKAAQMDDVEGIQDSMPDVPPVQISSEGPDGARGMGLDDREKRPSGMLAFLSRKKGRDRSPKSRERGVLGKEGARVVVAP
jgi:serine/threonine kinase 32